jgi:hypothetical protein
MRRIMNAEKSPDDEFNRRLAAMLSMVPRGTDKEAFVNRVTAKEILQEEMGQRSLPQREYGLDQTTRDRLLAHTRQDAAHALLNTMTLMKEVRELRRRSAAFENTVALTFLILFIGWAWGPKLFPILKSFFSPTS